MSTTTDTGSDALALDLQTTLRTFTATWSTLADPEHAPRRGSTGARTNDDPRLPGGTDRLHVLAGIHHWTMWWTEQLVAQPGTLALTTDLEPLNREEPAALAQWLAPHAVWITRHAYGPEAATWAGTLARHAIALVEQVRHNRPVVGQCPTQVDGEEACGGTLRAYLGDDVTRLGVQIGAVIACDHDWAHRWDDLQWRDLGHRLGHISAQAPERMRAEQLAAWLSVRFARPITRGNVDVWKHRYAWFPRPDAQGFFDRVRVTEWLIARHAA